MHNKTIKVSLLDILIYLSLTFLCMQFFVSNSVKIGFCVFFDSLGIKHILMITTVIVGLFSDLKHGKLKIVKFSYEIKMALFAVISILVISFGYMAFNGFADYWISQVYFLILPLLFAYTIFKNDYSVKRFKSIVRYLLIVTSILYSVFIFDTIFFKDMELTFSFMKSTSPFESETAHFYLLIYIFYTFIEDKRGRLVSAFFCIMAWKRISLICLILITIAGFMKLRNKRVKIGYIIAIAVIFSIYPLINEYMMSAEFGRWFSDITGITFVDFSNFRYYALKATIDGGMKSHGLGTFFSVRVPWYGHYVNISLHNDIMRLYLEVSIVGLFLFLLFTGAIARRRFSMFVILYLFLEMTGNHLIGNGGIPYWLLVYSLLFFFNMYDRDGLGNVYRVEEYSDGNKRLKRHISIKNGKISFRK
ncbi:MAG: hypothetical protein IJ932_01765 [Ruminococcus sp.]|nr:hypothetical protein [Ruminococcus sp.]